jgi:hypothetical protein
LLVFVVVACNVLVWKALQADQQAVVLRTVCLLVSSANVWVGWGCMLLGVDVCVSVACM